MDKDISTKEEKPVSTSAAVAELRAKSKDAAAQQLQKDITPPASRRTSTSTFPRRMPPREMSSSIASNLASARGIRYVSATTRALSPGITAADASGIMGPPPPRRRANQTPQAKGSPKPSWLPPIENDAAIARITSKNEAARRNSRDESGSTFGRSARDHAREQQATIAEEGFAKFYSAFESLKSKLSAPLAFAGLPLISEEDSSSPTAAPSSPAPASASRFGGQRRATTTGEPDLTKYFSKAAIKASLTTSQAAVNDSFYVVPTSGGTVSYAQMVGYDDQARENYGREEAGDDNEGDEDFVDAREHPVTPKAGRSFGASFGRRSAEDTPIKVGISRKGSVAGCGKTVEELTIENESLKRTLDAAAVALEREKKTLRKFQMESQAGTMAVSNMLHESGILTRSGNNSMHSSVLAAARGASGWTEQPVTGGVDVEVLRKEIQDLRAEVGREKRARRKLESDQQKDKVEREKERAETAKELENLRVQIESFRGDAVKYRQLEKSAREKAEKRRKEGRSDRGGPKEGGSDGRGGSGDGNGGKANDAARFVVG